MRQVLRAGALGRPRGMGWGWRWDGGWGWGTHVNPWLIHVNVWQKPLQYCKVISLQLIKINEKKIMKVFVYCPVFPGGASGKIPTCQCRRHKKKGFNTWVGKIPWRRAWQHTPVFLPGESHGQRSLMSYSPQCHKESDTTEAA